MLLIGFPQNIRKKYPFHFIVVFKSSTSGEIGS
jgi:hypothetical protein